MDVILEMLKYILPSVVVFATAYYLVKKFLESENKKRLLELRMANQSNVTPIRLQAYERIALFLERISPTNLIMRINKSGMNSSQLQLELIKNIRSEFEHNLSQQIYMSNAAWEMVKTAKEEVIKLVNIAGTKVSNGASGNDLAQAIIEISLQVEKLPTQMAIEYMKREIAQNF
ncbi:MAG: hypothetical protein ABI199_02675 [Bacteroidia bacterium]